MRYLEGCVCAPCMSMHAVTEIGRMRYALWLHMPKWQNELFTEKSRLTILRSLLICKNVNM